jgi:hypothetical protein
VLAAGSGALAAPAAQMCGADRNQIVCGGVCADTRVDPRNCGGCGWNCGSGTCSAGVCVCQSNLLACAGGCVDTAVDPGNCGTCGNLCPAGNVCTLGRCTPPVVACNPVCAPTQQCIAGVCQCPEGQIFCAGVCLDTRITAEHCGMCGHQCAPAQLCQAGQCVCAPGQMLCGAECADVTTSNKDCGACGAACAAGEVCMAGQCRAPVGADGCSGGARDISLSGIDAYQTIKIPLIKGTAAVASKDRVAAVVQGRLTMFRVSVTPGTGFMPRMLSARVVVKNGATMDQFFAKQMISKASTDADSASTFQITVPAAKIQDATTYSVELVECGAAPTGGMLLQQRFPAMGEAPLETKKTGVLKVRVIPLVSNSHMANTADTALKIYKDFLEAMYPIEQAQLEVGKALNVAYPVDWNNTLDQLRQRRQTDKPPTDVYYYGFLMPTDNFKDYCRNGCTAGVGYVGSLTQAATHVAMGLAYGDELSAGVMAHEVGHNHGRNHAPCAPGNQISGVDRNYPYMGAITNTWGYDSRKQTFFSPDKAKDIMGYCDPKWISDYTYKGLVDRVAAINLQMIEFPATQDIQQYSVLLVDQAGPRWSQPFLEPEAPFGDAEQADVLDIDGRPIDRVTVYRTLVGDQGSTILVPPAKRGWNAVRTSDGAMLPFSAPISVPRAE